MNFQEPFEDRFTVYSKSGCEYCTNVERLLKEKNINFTIIDCIDYMNDSIKRRSFLLFIKEKAKKEVNKFPMIFYKGEYIGGYIETKQFIKKEFLSFEDLNF